ncbi:hypothetical protein P7C73_g6211, partial [Tremellales sp. Uapishka_1]
MIASKKMKQLQWDKVSKTQLAKTVWGEPEVEEEALMGKMKAVDLWSEMEDEFKAREIIYDAVKKRKETELLSVLAPDTRKRIEILMAGSSAKSFKAPERLSEAIANFNAELCSETFLRELQGVLPNDDDVGFESASVGVLADLGDREQRGKLLTHSADTPQELELLHPADRLMVRLIQLPHLGDRVKGMLFQVRFSQNMELLSQSLDLLTAACEDLRNAKLFRELLNVILTMGNYLNGTNFAGGAFGFKIGSINKLVDTKSSNGQNLLHFLERTVTTHFPHLEGFMDELQRPSDANRVNFQDMQSTSRLMLEEIRHIRQSLSANFESHQDGYTKKMFRFSAAAEEDLQFVRDGIVQAEGALRDVETFYGEGEEHGRPVPSQDFFGIFRTFTSSYKFCRAQNRARTEEKLVKERRAQARAALTPNVTGSSTMTETNLIDARLNRFKLEGTPRVKRERRQPMPPLSPVAIATDFSSLNFMLPDLTGSSDFDFGGLANDMLRNIHGTGGTGGLDVERSETEAMSPPSPSPSPLDAGGLESRMLVASSPPSLGRQVDEEEDQGERVPEEEDREEMIHEEEEEGGDETE